MAIIQSYWKVYSITHTDGDESVAEKTEKQCYAPPFWAHILKMISKLLLTINASVGCFVYCVMCPVFREEISKKFRKLIYIWHYLHEKFFTIEALPT